MKPVLELADVEAGRRHLCERLGFRADASDPRIVRFGGQAVRIAETGEIVAGVMPLRFDHLALSVPDLDAVIENARSHGARLHAAFTPDGPREIPEFGSTGVRFAFFEGPEGWPIEFVAPLGMRGRTEGHGHFGLRTTDVSLAAAPLLALGAETIDQYRLAAPHGVVEVAFLRLDGFVFELFDEPFAGLRSPAGGWTGFLR